ncbi:SLAM family member 5 [Colossoma macropomum]|uniref:SLAM family member 5 n=1 Tax=Colossoma macropomum TaxID=42526 RepID=UPI0018644BB2|nr:SLAM family member 5 [Colossoma macropomum]
MHCSLHIIIIVFIIMSFTAAHVVHQHYELVGKTVHLSLGKQRPNQMRWKKDADLIAVVNEQNPDVRFTEKFSVNATDGSLIIKNVTESDSGRYQALCGKWEDEITEFHLTVEEAVSEPVIDTYILQLNSSTRLCLISVKCSVDGDSMMYDCDFKTCTQDLQTNTSLTKVNITVAVRNNEKVECTASNHVSTKTSSIHLSDTCSKNYSSVEDQSQILLGWPVLIACGLGCLLLVCFLITAYLYSRKKQQNKGTLQEEGISTIYSVVRKPQSPTESNLATTVYDVPSKFVKAPQSASVQMSKETQAPPLEDKAVTANAEREEESENDKQLTVYWKLGQK